MVNDVQGVPIEVEGPPEALDRFLHRVRAEAPEHAHVHAFDAEWLDPEGLAGFAIRESAGGGGERSAAVLPDLATCADCRREIADPEDRRHRYPFTNCTHCGPRFTIIRALPYDRAATTMAASACARRAAPSTTIPRDRRFHAQPNACPACGPALALAGRPGVEPRGRRDALAAAVDAIAGGRSSR